MTVKVPAAPVAAAGTVSLREGETLRGSTTLAVGTATFTLPVGLSCGTHTLTAAYCGSDDLDLAQATVTVTVNLPVAWSASTVYHDGSRVAYQGKVFVTSWYAKGDQPGDPNGPWKLIG